MYTLVRSPRHPGLEYSSDHFRSEQHTSLYLVSDIRVTLPQQAAGFLFRVINLAIDSYNIGDGVHIIKQNMHTYQKERVIPLYHDEKNNIGII